MALQQHDPFSCPVAGTHGCPAPNPAHMRGLAPVSGLPGDAQVLTRRGFCSADEIEVGQALVTREQGLQAVVEIERVTVRSRMVRFSREVLSDPEFYEALRLPTHQLVNLRDWRATVLQGKAEAQAAAASLIDDAYITDDGIEELQLTRLFFPSATTLYVGGMEVLSAHTFDDQLRPVF